MPLRAQRIDQAIIEFDAVRRKYPQETRAGGAAETRLRVCGVGEKVNARLILQEVVEKYPQSSEAAKVSSKASNHEPGCQPPPGQAEKVPLIILSGEMARGGTGMPPAVISMEILRHLDDRSLSSLGSVATLGNFDGLHLGHQALVRGAVEDARRLGVHSVVLTFEPHPLKVLAPARAPKLLLSHKDKMELLQSFGVDVVVIQKSTLLSRACRRGILSLGCWWSG
jgi:hypothetical protein